LPGMNDPLRDEPMRLGKENTFWMVVFLLLAWRWDCAAVQSEGSIGDRFTGEALRYEVGFWLIDPVGGGVADFQNLGHGRYRVYHVGKAEGFVGWLTNYRREIYRSTMTTINDGKRLIPLKFEEYSVIGEWYRNKTTTYDYPGRRVIIEMEKEGKPMKREEMEIPMGVLYDDPVTAFYNLRFGVYGKVEPGKEFVLRTIPSKGHEIIRIQVATKEEAERARAAEKVKTGKDLLIRILLDREMWGRKKGELEIWFNRDLLPISGVVKDIPWFGDVSGRKTWHGFSPVPLPEEVPGTVGKKSAGPAK
jgi:hypothetical protein